MVERAENVAYIFPGQGSQRSEKTDQLSVQMAVVSNSCFLLDHARRTNSNIKELIPGYFAGHSVGMWPAAYAANVVDYSQLLEAIEVRGSLMEKAGPGTMMAVMGKGWRQFPEIWNGEGVNLAAVNYSNQFVISGREQDVSLASVLARERGARVAAIGAAGPNHSKYMESIQPQFREYLSTLKFCPPIAKIVLDYKHTSSESVEEIREGLVGHLSKTVWWEESVLEMIALGVEIFIEWGSDMLSKFIGRINHDVRIISITSIDEAERIRF